MKSGNYIRVLGARIHFEFLNAELLNSEKPLLVFLHEGLGSIAQWKDFPVLLSEKIHCAALLFDREGYGKSDPLKAARDWDYLHIQAQKALPEIFIRLHLEQIKKILIGHSDGGSIAIIHAGSCPENIIGVITEASHQFIEDISVRGIREAAENYQKDGKLKSILRKYHGEKTDEIFYAWADTWQRPGFQQWNIEEYLKKIDIPFLAVQGVEDQYGSVAQLESIRRYVKRSEIRHIPNCGHNPHIQHKEMMVQIMAEFISTLL